MLSLTVIVILCLCDAINFCDIFDVIKIKPNNLPTSGFSVFRYCGKNARMCESDNTHDARDFLHSLCGVKLFKEFWVGPNFSLLEIHFNCSKWHDSIPVYCTNTYFTPWLETKGIDSIFQKLLSIFLPTP